MAAVSENHAAGEVVRSCLDAVETEANVSGVFQGEGEAEDGAE
jgi:hypothetical protein